MNMRTKTTLATLALALLVTGCANMSETQQGTAKGAGIGAAAGAVLGALTGGSSGAAKGAQAHVQQSLQRAHCSGAPTVAATGAAT